MGGWVVEVTRRSAQREGLQQLREMGFLLPARPGPADADAGGTAEAAEAAALAVLRRHGGRVDAAVAQLLAAPATPAPACPVAAASAAPAPPQRPNAHVAAGRAPTGAGASAGRGGKRLAAGQTDLRVAFGLAAKPARRT